MLTGAGISAGCGISTFRDTKGLWRLQIVRKSATT
ncbi:MAG TPA: hypothetical protein DCR43_06200 [Bacteroidales bacterium]|nr:hypothetical protein [Bacteroidales bacterium]HBZ66979.1 hypothetical protein [Bacteroidales bacterium]